MPCVAVHPQKFAGYIPAVHDNLDSFVYPPVKVDPPASGTVITLPRTEFQFHRRILSMNATVYVGNLPYRLQEEQLAEAFRPYGEVISVKIITDRFSGRSRGFGFVEMSTPEEAQNAIDNLNGTELGGRTLVVAPANPPKHSDQSA